MTDLLERGIAAARRLPAERQDFAGELLLTVAAQADGAFELSPEQWAEVDAAIRDADNGLFATDEEMAEVWRPSGQA